MKEKISITCSCFTWSSCSNGVYLNQKDYRLIWFYRVLFGSTSKASISVFNKWIIFSLSGLTPLDNGFPQTCQEKVKKDLAGGSTTASITAAEQTAGLCTNAKLYRSFQTPQVGSKASLAAKWQWQDHSVPISSTFFPWAQGSSYCGQCTPPAVQSPALWIGWSLGFRQPLTSFVLCPCVPASDNQKMLFAGSIPLMLVVLYSR